MPTLKLQELDGDYAIVQLPTEAEIPRWWTGEGFAAVSRTNSEVSVVCRSERVPEGMRLDAGWVAFTLAGIATLSGTGDILALVRPLSENGLSVFVVSAFSGISLLIKRDHVERARRYLQAAGHRFV